MTIEFHCPFCQKVLKTADDKAGVKANCPGCGEAVTVPSADSAAAKAEPLWTENAAAGTSAQITDSGGAAVPPESAATGDTRPCPMCGAEIKRAALRCRFCGENLIEPDDDGGSGQIEAGDILSRSWEIFQKNLGILVGSTLVLMGIGGASFIAAYLATIAVAVAIAGPGPGGQGPDAAAIALIVAAGSLFMLLFFAVNAFLGAGYNVLLIRIARGERAELGDLFSGGRYFWRMFWGNVLFGVLALVGFALFIVPYVFVILIFWPYTYVIVDQNTGVVESFQKSRELTSGNLLTIFILGLAVMGINMLGQMACYVGMIFSVPLGALIFAVAYCRMSRQATGGVRRN
jgi:uncharacterized membrane protein/phage FluMu protein Com